MRIGRMVGIVIWIFDIWILDIRYSIFGICIYVNEIIDI